MDRYITYILTLCSLINTYPQAHAQQISYQQFNNIYLGADAAVISCFLQDSEGLIWIGSNKGLFSYDGYSSQAHYTHGEQSNTRIYCEVIVDPTYLFLGSDNGILIYNYKTDRYEKPTVQFPSDVRTLTLQGDILWIGTLNGLYTYQLKKKELKAIDSKKTHLPHSTIYSIIHTQDNQIYIGTYNGLCRYNVASQTFEPIRLPSNKEKNNLFINSLLEDTTHSCIWIGTEGSLFKYTPQSDKMEYIKFFHDNSIKSLAMDGNGSLLAGTDNGMYVYSGDSNKLQHIVHDSRNIQSLTNNIIWNIFTDSEHNIWLGTDYGISLARYNSAFQFIPISQITKIGDGNQFYSMYRDSRKFYWFGGTNGLIRFTDPTGTGNETQWYKMGDAQSPLAHNRIRHIYEDKQQNLWIATDGSIHRYDYGKRQFIHYNIVDSTGSYNTNWTYYLFEDNKERLWIATCLGGIFVVDKKKLLASGSNPYIADQNYSIRNGLSGMFINQIVPDREGNVWVLLYNSKGINKINPNTGKVTKIFEKELANEHIPNYLLADQAGYLWVGYRGGVMRIQPKDSSFRMIPLGTFGNDEILAMADIEGDIWISTTNGLWIIDKTMNPRQLNMTDKRFTNIFFDRTDRHIYLGGADGFAISQPEVSAIQRTNHPIRLTALYINNQLYTSTLEAEAPIIRYTHNIELNDQQNNLAFDVSDLPYSLDEKNKFVYQLQGIDKEWNYLKANTNRITYSNLNYGHYQLIIKKLSNNGTPSNTAYTLSIRINPPWYYTAWAKTIYAILMLSLIAWTINFFWVKSRLKLERMEKEKILEQSRSKMDFFSHLSNELKNPLSHIIAPISKLLPNIQKQAVKEILGGVQQNAMKINSLLHQMLDFSSIEDPKDSLLILSRIELISFTRSQFSLYKESLNEKVLHFSYEANIDSIYADMDAIKLGVILNNLLSNAVKFTPEGGSVSFSLSYQKESGLLDICISDTGVGIPTKDIPYIFQRFFQSSQNQTRREGTGIGLYLVKSYTELHGGHISKVNSQEEKGTSIQLTLPVIAIQEELKEKNQSVTVESKAKAIVPLRPIEAESLDEKFLTKIIRLIEDHISNSDLNVNALCDLSGIANKQIYRKIKQLTGMTPVEYIKSIRMKKAAMLLQQKKFTVAEVMYMVGFSNHSYFSKCFQSEFGVTPKEYLNNY